jgi:VanZ family protein
MRALLKSWLPVVLWTGLIFLLSTGIGAGGRTVAFLIEMNRRFHLGIGMQEILALNHCIRKAAHATEYALLAVLLWRGLALPGGWPGWGWNRRTLGEAFLVAVAYAVTDEFHQAFVPGRGSQVSDVVIDGSGAALGLLVAWGVRALGRRRATSA